MRLTASLLAAVLATVLSLGTPASLRADEISAVGARGPRLDLADRGRPAKLAEETGGRGFCVDSAAELDGVYALIEDELRSRHLIASEPNAAPRAGELRPVEVRVAGAGRRVKAARGYHP